MSSERQHKYIHVEAPFELDGRMVCWATELLRIPGYDGAQPIKRLLDAGTMEPVFSSQSGGPLTIHADSDGKNWKEITCNGYEQ